jgi:hypothetical protein
MDWHTRSLVKDSGKMKRRCVHGTGNVIQCDTLTEPARQIDFGRLSAVYVIGISPISARLAWYAVSHERTLSTWR